MKAMAKAGAVKVWNTIAWQTYRRVVPGRRQLSAELSSDVLSRSYYNPSVSQQYIVMNNFTPIYRVSNYCFAKEGKISQSAGRGGEDSLTRNEQRCTPFEDERLAGRRALPE